MLKAHVFFNSSVDLVSTGRDASFCNKALRLNLNKRKAAVNPCSESIAKKRKHQDDSIAAETKKIRIGVFGVKKDEDERSNKTRETGETKQIDDRRKSFAAARRTIQTKKKQSALPMKVSRNLKKPDVCKSVLATSRPPLKLTKVSENPKICPAWEKNDTGTLELFDIAKQSADVANTKGLLASEAETSICVDSLSLLLEFPISAADIETKRIMVRLEHLTHHKSRKICNSALALLHCWRQSIRDQQPKRVP